MATTIKRERGKAGQSGGVPARRAGTSMAVAALIGLLAAVVGFGAGWLAFGESGPGGPSEVREVADEYRAAWVANDGQAAVAMMDRGALFYSDFVPDGITGERLVRHIETVPTAFIADLEIIRVEGDGPYLVVLEAKDQPGDYSVIHIEERNEELKIVDHIWLDG